VAKEQTFEHPPRGHVALLVYDADNDCWQVLRVESGSSPNLLVGVAKGGVQAHVGTPSADNFLATTPGLWVVGHLYAFDGTYWDRLRADAGALRVGGHGYDGSAWRKLPLLLGRSAAWDEQLGGTATGTTWEKATSEIPAGQVRVLTACSIRNITHGLTNVFIYVTRASGAKVFIAYAATLATNVPMFVTGTFVLEAGDVLHMYAGVVTVGDTIESGLTGYKMQVDT